MMTKLVFAALMAAAMPVAAFGADGAATPKGPVVNQTEGFPLTVREMNDLTKPLLGMPDAELAVVLPASTFPVEIVVAQRWMEGHADATAAEIDGQSWPEPVRALAHNPEALKLLNDKLEWTQALGKTFLVEGDEVLRSVQLGRGDGKAGIFEVVKGQVVTGKEGVAVRWPDRPGGTQVTTQVITPVVAGSMVYGYGNNYQCDWDNYAIMDSGGVDWRCRLGAIGPVGTFGAVGGFGIGRGRERGGLVTIVNGPGAVGYGGVGYGGVVYGGGYGGAVYTPGYTGNVIVNSGPGTLYGAPTFQRTGYSFTPTLNVAPGRAVFVGRR